MKKQKKKDKEKSSILTVPALSETVVPQLERMELSNKPTLVITKKLKRQIDFLHKKQGGSEWSGELITREEGTINDLDAWKITAEEMFLADLGSPGFTGYEVDKGGFKSVDIVDMYEAYPGLLDGTQKNHHIHSHHRMGCFFSGVDWSQLNDRSLVSNYFLMLIVNIAGDAIAKVAFKAKKEVKSPTRLSFINNHDGFTPLDLKQDENKEILVVMSCKVEIEVEEVEKEFIDRYTSVSKAIELEEKARQEELKKKYSHNGMNGYSYGAPGSVKQGKFYYDEYDKDKYEFNQMTGEWHKKGEPRNPISGKQYYHKATNDWRHYPEKSNSIILHPSKRISEMTDKEWGEYDSGQVGYSTSMPEDWDLRHAKIMINCLLKDTVHPDTSDCRDLLLQTSTVLDGEEKKREETIEDFGLGLIESYQLMFPGKAADKDAYYDLLEKMVEYLQPYSYIDITSDLIEEVKNEMEEIKEELLTKADIYDNFMV